jgi:hypothetical protein
VTIPLRRITAVWRNTEWRENSPDSLDDLRRRFGTTRQAAEIEVVQDDQWPPNACIVRVDPDDAVILREEPAEWEVRERGGWQLQRIDQDEAA